MTLKVDSYMFDKWTKQAIECFKRKCICFGCVLEDLCKHQKKDNPYEIIPMKWSVLMLVRRLGEPKEREYVNESTDRSD